ncbi:MAG: hypothetical protein GY751_06075 [Bacteroidetes bacterium]|nr:hypothetical protein [Bacteroidota bacterium]
MDTILIIEIISSVLIVLGVGLMELHQYHLARKREAATLLLSAYQSRDFFAGLTPYLQP